MVEGEGGRLKEDDEEYLRQHPYELDAYISTMLDVYTETRDLGKLLVSLRIASRIKGVTTTAKAAGMTRNGLQKALRETSNPMFATVDAIMHALGYRLTVERKATDDLGMGEKGVLQLERPARRTTKRRIPTDSRRTD